MNIISKIFGAKPGDSDAADKIETAEEAPVVEPTDLDGPLPSTFGELLPILTRLGGLKGTHTTRSAWRKWHLRHQDVRKLCFDLQQVPKLGDITPDAHAINRQRIDGGPERRAARIAKLEAFLKLPTPEFNKPPSYGLDCDPKQALLEEPVIQQDIWMCRRLLAEAEIHEHTHFDLAYPTSRAHELESEMQRATDLDRVRTLRAELSTIKTLPGSRVGEMNARGSFSQKYQPALAAIGSLLKTCSGFYLLWQLDALDAEEFFFAAYGLPRQSTQVSARFEAATKHLPTASNSTLEYFGVNDIAAV